MILMNILVNCVKKIICSLKKCIIHSGKNTWFNTLLYIICGIAIQSWILPLYSIVTYYVGSRTVDFITEGFDRAKCAMIVTVKANEISNALSENFDSSGTIVNRFQINKLKNIVHDIDESAFISLQEVADIIKKKE